MFVGDQRKQYPFTDSDADDLRKRIINRMNVNTELDIPTYDEICRDDGRTRQTPFKQKDQDLSNVRIKTLAEIRAEKKLRDKGSESPKTTDPEISSTNAEVSSSTSKMEEAEEAVEKVATKRKMTGIEQVARKRPKLRRPQILESENTVSSAEEEKKEKGGGGVRKHEGRVDSSKFDEMLLLGEDDLECANVSLQAEEDLLKDIDDLLSE